MNAKNDLAIIQAEVQAPKNKFNSFGKYAYRSAENIIEAVKPIINPKGYHLILSDEMVIIGERYYIKATATISNGEKSYSATSYAREPEEKKGMDSAQISGTTGSYSRKYALNGLFALDDNKDSDAPIYPISYLLNFPTITVYLKKFDFCDSTGASVAPDAADYTIVGYKKRGIPIAW